MKKCRKLLSILSCAAMVVNMLPGISASAYKTDVATVKVIASDETTQWKETNPNAAKSYYASFSNENGFAVDNDADKYTELKNKSFYEAANKWMVYMLDGVPVTQAEGEAAGEAANKLYWSWANSSTSYDSMPDRKYNFPINDDVASARDVYISMDYHIAGYSYMQDWMCNRMVIGNEKTMSIYLGEYDGKPRFSINTGNADVTTLSNTERYPYTNENGDLMRNLVLKFTQASAEENLMLAEAYIDGVAVEVPEGATTGKTTLTGISLTLDTNNTPATSKDRIRNLVITEGAPLTAAPKASIADGAKKVNLEEGVTFTFDDPIDETTKDNITLWANGEAKSATVTLSQDKKTATLTATDAYDADCEIKVEGVKNILGGAVDNYTLNFKTGEKPVKPAVLLASDTDANANTKWSMNFSWRIKEAGVKRVATWETSETGAMKIHHRKADYDALKAVTYKIGNTYDTGETTDPKWTDPMYGYRVNAEGEPVANDSADAVGEPEKWYGETSGRSGYTPKFSGIADTADTTTPLYITFDYFLGNINNAWNSPYVKIAGKSLYLTPTHFGFNSNEGKTAVAQTEDKKHNIQMVLSNNAENSNYLQFDNIWIDGVAMDLTGKEVQSTTTKVSSIEAFAEFESNDLTYTIENLKVYRGIPTVTAEALIEENEDRIDLANEGVSVKFSAPVNLEEGAISLLKNGAAVDGTVVTQSEDKTTATITLDNYDFRTTYQLYVNRDKVTSLLGGKCEDSVRVNFKTISQPTIYEPSTDMGDLSGATRLGITQYDGAAFETHEYDAATDTLTITVNNKDWNEAMTKTVEFDKDGKADTGVDGKEYTSASAWDVDGDGDLDPLGYRSRGWGDDQDYSGVKLPITETTTDGKPLYISFDYEINKFPDDDTVNTCGAMLTMGFQRTNPWLGSLVFGQSSPGIRKTTNGWGQVPVGGSTEPGEKHTFEYMLNPTYAADETTVPMVGALDYGTPKTHADLIAPLNGEITDHNKDGVANSGDMYLKNGIMVLIPRDKDSDEPTVVKISNLKVMRLNDFTVAMNDVCSKATDENPSIEVVFSDVVEEAELSKLVVNQGMNVIDGAIKSAVLTDDGLGATITLDTTVITAGRYSLDVSALMNAYNAAVTGTTDLPFTYNVADEITMIEVGTADRNDKEVSFTLINNTIDSMDVTAIIAAYAEDGSLVDVNSKTVTVAANDATPDTLSFDTVTNAKDYKLMVWDDIMSMKPYCLAYPFK